MSSICPKCQGQVVHNFNTGRAMCHVCIECGWCIVHNKTWPSVARKNEGAAP